MGVISLGIRTVPVLSVAKETRCTAADSDSTGREVRADQAGSSGLTMTVDWVLKNFCLVVLFFSSRSNHRARGAY